MIVVLSDTHGREGHRLAGRTREAVREAALVCHCGDFVTPAVLDAFERTTADAGADFAAVYGNNDTPEVRDRTADTRVVDHGGLRLALAHGHEHTDTSLALFGRQANADLVCVGHSHDPGFGRLGSVPVLNPGSHAEPRFHRAAHAELVPSAKVLDGRLVSPEGDVFERFELEL
ncbi:metallophosphoesterase [Halosegnis marinus]|uniref:Phosphoesterase n=1 Tax=Halosegnis marinus TaxID=3034023 RepID=A0ABD5ZN58_9EURY|nr:metallophosphoesterase [Halosegnis sp. DT85]